MCLVLLVSVVGLVGQRAQANEGELRRLITVQPGATCLRQDQTVQLVARWLTTERVPPSMRIEVAGDLHDAHTVTFVIQTAHGTRRRSFAGLPDDCATASELVALAIALGVDAAALTEAAETAAVHTKNRVVTQLAVGRELVAGWSLGGSLAIERDALAWLTARLGLLAHGSWRQRIPATSGTINTWLLAAHPELCTGAPATAMVRLQLCSGVALGMQGARGHGFAKSAASHAFWSMGSTALRAHVPGWLPLVVDVGLWFPLKAPELRALDDRGHDRVRARKVPAFLVQIGPTFDF